ncbi:hypothetical protein [Teichococcus oryzae]|uniref:hypothetical protein n=1 Tax=Teichococcus oryzae TaxID=1608942 RepID=UPI0013754ACC|nr:hypothetical protein [Pseudoroseomonas oryzae]
MGVAIAVCCRPGWRFRAVAPQALSADGAESESLTELERQVRRAMQPLRQDDGARSRAA